MKIHHQSVYFQFSITIKNIGYNTNRIKKEKIFTEAQLQQMRENNFLTQKALNKICKLLNCQPGDILECVPYKDRLYPKT